jgi:O-methyltransferase
MDAGDILGLALVDPRWQALGKRLWESALTLLVRVGRLLGLPGLSRRLAEHAPRRLQLWLRDRRFDLKLRAGETTSLIAELDFTSEGTLKAREELKLKYRDGLLLLSERHGQEKLGDYLEFGVYVGGSLACMHHVLDDLRLDHVRLFGFDSFEGLPETTRTDTTSEVENWQPGDFKSPYDVTRENLTQTGVDWDRTILVKGWFDDTLTREFQQQHGVSKASIIMVDCDLYSSTKTALEFCAPLIVDEAIVFFDDWLPATLGQKNLGEKRAFHEFLDAHPYFTAVELDTYRPDAAKVFLVSRRDGKPAGDGQPRREKAAHSATTDGS